jgi:hypothetical protein
MSEERKDFVPLEEYFNTDFDFGITPVDDEDVDSLEKSQEETVSVVSDELTNSIENINSRLNSIFMLLDSKEEPISNEIEFSRIEEKIDKILDMETNEFSRALQDNSDNIRVVIDEIEERKKDLEEKTKERMIEIEEMVFPLLYNLMKSSEKDYIYWPNRKEKIEKQIHRIISVTRRDF